MEHIVDHYQLYIADGPITAERDENTTRYKVEYDGILTRNRGQLAALNAALDVYLSENPQVIVAIFVPVKRTMLDEAKRILGKKDNS